MRNRRRRPGLRAARPERHAPIAEQLLAGGPVVLFFYPAAMTYGCTKESCHFRDLKAEFAAVGAQPVGISADQVDKQRQFDEKESLGFPLLSDPDRYGGGATRGQARTELPAQQEDHLRDRHRPHGARSDPLRSLDGKPRRTRRWRCSRDAARRLSAAPSSPAPHPGSAPPAPRGSAAAGWHVDRRRRARQADVVADLGTPEGRARRRRGSRPNARAARWPPSSRAPGSPVPRTGRAPF